MDLIDLISGVPLCEQLAIGKYNGQRAHLP